MKKSMIRALALSLAALSLILSMTSCAPTASSHDEKEPSGNSFLPVITPSTQGVPLPAKRYNAFSRLVEYLIIGADYNNSNLNQTLVDPYACFLKTSQQEVVIPEGVTSPNQEILDARLNLDVIAANKKAAKAGNFDDDFQDETALVYWSPAGGSGVLTIIDAGDSGVQNLKPANLDLSIGTDDLGADYDLALADLDGDGYDEIVISGSIVDSSKSDGKIWILDDGRNGYALIETITLTGIIDLTTGKKGVKKLKVAAGVITEDRVTGILAAWYDSSFVTGSGTGKGSLNYILFDGEGHELTDGLTSSIVLESLSANPDLFNVALADVDGDGLDEAVFTGMNSYTNYMYGVTEIKDDYSHSLASLVTHSTASAGQQWYCAANYGSYPARFLVPVNFDGDRAKELAIGPRLYEYDANALVYHACDFIDPATAYVQYSTDIADIGAGDVNGDLMEDILVMTKAGVVKSYGLLNNTDTKTYGWNLHDTSGTGTNALANAILVPLNVDKDSTLVEYDAASADASPVEIAEAHRTEYRDVKLIALLAAPPTLDGIGQNTGNSSTSLGTGTGAAYTIGSDFSVRAGIVAGFEFSVSAGFICSTETLRVELEIENQIELGGSYSTEHTVTETVTNTAAAGEDLVVCSAVPYDVYTYTVSSHPDPTMVGSAFTLAIPQTVRIFYLTRDYYNENTSGMKISAGLLPDTPYALSTYPQGTSGVEAVLAQTEVDVGDGIILDTEIAELARSSGANLVPQGSGTQSVEIEITDTETWGASLTYSCDVAAKVIAGGVKVGLSAGYSIGGYYDSSSSTSMTFCGVVGGIPAAAFNQNQYRWGMFAYKQKLKDEEGCVMQDFIVVNYWIE